MRKAQKKQAEGFVELLGQAHDEIKKAIEKKNIPAALSLLADCQDGAISLGELIEKTEGEDAPTISILEGYCEELYRIHEELSQEQAIAGKVHKTLRQSLTEIKNSIKNDIKIRQEVVFLPYKASMWDSLESVWKAAEEDPDCDVYVIPIPYYDKNPDGSFREKHYEGDQYPYYVPVVRYEDYDFEKRMPDKIFIHNPYDENNYVTSVEPFFYSSNLKKFTDQLVYIPYFILGEIDPEDQTAADGMKHFCIQPGVINADRVIVQSEAMRQVYVNVLTAHMAGAGYKRKYWEDRILGLGSPKVDKVLNTRKEDLAIPKEWLKVIQKPDGSFKKIVFYNTSVTALLHHNEKMLVKMRDVFSIFRDNRDEVALLWRPHPLIKATISSMRPQLWAEYEKMVEEYKEEGWGIYDDTADMDRAVILSDAYYGDHSSVVQLYQKTEKPVVIQNIGNEAILWSYVFYDRKIYCTAKSCNIVFFEDIEMGKAEIIGSVPKENFFAFNLYYAGVHYNNKIFLIPCEAREVAVIDLSDYSIRKIHNIGEMKYFEACNVKYATYYCKDNILYLIPACFPMLVEIDLDKERVVYSKNILCEYEKIIGQKNTYFSANDNYVLKDKMYVACWDRALIMEYDLTTRVNRYFQVKENSVGFCCMAGDEEKLYLITKNGELIIWNIKTRLIERVIPIKISNKSHLEFRRSLNNGNRIYFFTADMKGIISYDKISQEMRDEIDKWRNVCLTNNEESQYFVSGIENKHLLLYTTNGSFLDVNDEKISFSSKVTLNKEEVMNYVFMHCGHKTCQEFIGDIRIVLNNIVRESIDKEATTNSKFEKGKLIWKELYIK